MCPENSNGASRDNSFGTTADTEQHVDAAISGCCSNRHGNVTLVKAHPGCTGGLDLFDHVLVARFVDYGNAQIGNRNFFGCRERENVFGWSHVDVADSEALDASD